MGDEHRDTGTGWPEREAVGGPPPAAPVDADAADDAAVAAAAVPSAEDMPEAAPRPDDDQSAPREATDGAPVRQRVGWSLPGRLGPAGLGIAVLLATTFVGYTILIFFDLVFLAALLATSPVAIIFLIFQRYFVRGATEGAEKG